MRPVYCEEISIHFRAWICPIHSFSGQFGSIYFFMKNFSWFKNNSKIKRKDPAMNKEIIIVLKSVDFWYFFNYKFRRCY